MDPSRRDLLKALAGVPLLFARQQPATVTTVNGVVFGVETFSFHDLPPSGDPQLIPTIIKSLQTLGIAECEIMSGHIEPYASVMTGWWVQSRRAPDFGPGLNVSVPISFGLPLVVVGIALVAAAFATGNAVFWITGAVAMVAGVLLFASGKRL